MKKDMIERYSELSGNRNRIASASIEALTTLAENEDGAIYDGYELAMVHDSLLSGCLRDEEIDQREIANLIAVVNSTEAFSEDTRREAARRVRIMLEL